MTKNPRIRNYCFTSYNYDLDHIKKQISNTKLVKCYAMQEEICPTTKKTHLQGYVEFVNKRTFNGVKKLFKDKTIHLEKRKGTKQQAVAYCIKEDTRKPDTESYSHNIQMTGGYRPTFDTALMKYYAGDMSNREFLKLYPRYYTCNNESMKRVKLDIENDEAIILLRKKMANAVLRPWQQEALAKLQSQPTRKVLWIYDKVGNTGKSFLVDYLTVMLQGVFVITGGSAKDIAYAYQKEPYVVYDRSRSQEGMFSYKILEEFKNGRIFSSKYKSRTFIFTPAKVLVFANYLPETPEKLSEDRWDIYQITGQHMVKGNYTPITSQITSH